MREDHEPAGGPPSDWQRIKALLRKIPRRVRVALLIAADIAAMILIVLVYGALKPPPRPLTQAEFDAAVQKSIVQAPRKPSWQSAVYQAVLPSVVEVQAVSGQGGANESLGSGVVISDTGLILTCLHVIKGASQIQVVFSGGLVSAAQVTMTQPENDLALLSAQEIPDDLQPATLAGSAGLQPGDEVIAVGNPFGIPNSVTSGIVSGLNREYTDKATGTTLKNLIQFDAAVNPGNSGGPLVNRDGEVVGIVAALLNPTRQSVFIGIGFAVTIETAGGMTGTPPI